jgi:hypothetical protein
VRALNIGLLAVVLIFHNIHVALKLLMQAAQTRLLECDEVINVDEMVAQGHLVLLLGFVEVAIEHL